MTIAWKVLAGLAALFHVLFFLMESVLFLRPDVHARFGVESAEDAELLWAFAFNQGFYNLFLAVAIGVGIVLAGRTDARGVVGRTLVAYACLSMVGAGVVLAASVGKIAAACIQAGPPLLALAAMVGAGRGELDAPSTPAA